MRLAHLVERRHATGAAGSFTVRVDTSAGGATTLASPDVAVTFALTAELEVAGCRVRTDQRGDPMPRLTLLEEGLDRLGLRVEFRLWDGDRVLGEGLHELWLTQDGEAFLAWCLRVAMLEPFTVSRAAVEVATPGAASDAGDGTVAIGDPTGGAVFALPLQRGRRSDTVYWSATRPPFYDRWPPLFDQWSLDPATYGWDRFPSGGVELCDGGFELAWLREPVKNVRQIDLRGAALLTFGDRTSALHKVEAHENPFQLQAFGGRSRGYEELDGSYLVELEDEACRIVIPSDPLERTVRLCVDGLKPGERAEVQGAERVLHLSGRWRTDDPLVPVATEGAWPADELVASLRTRADEPTTVVVERRRGLALAYQRRDPGRRLTIHHPADPGQPICSVDLATVHLRDLRLPGKTLPAVFALPLYWMRYLPKAAIHHANELEAVEILQDDVERIRVRLVTSAPGGHVSSTYVVEVPLRDDGAVEVDMVANLVGADAWGLPTVEFADLFPEDSIDPRRWEYEHVVFVDEAGTRVSSARDPYPLLGESIRVPAPALEAIIAAHGQTGCGPWTPSGPGAVVLHGSPRGTIVAAAAVAVESGLETVMTLCEHWLDIHFDAAPRGGRPVASELGTAEPGGLPAVIEARLKLVVLPPEGLDLDAAIAEAQSMLEHEIPAAALTSSGGKGA